MSVDLPIPLIQVLQVLTVALAGPGVSGVIARVEARLQGRVGPRVLQPYYDIVKSFGKEALAPEGSGPMFLLAPLLSFACYLTVPMLIPVLVFDVTYHWDGEGDAFGQNAGSFVLGREQGASGSEKLAPLPLDHPNLVVNRPGARITAIRRSQ